MKKLLAIAAVLLAACTVAVADYEFRDGYYWQGGQAYGRYKEWWQEHVTYPYYHYQWKWRWAYEPVAIVEKKVVLPPITDRNWKTAAVDALLAKEENELYWAVYKQLNATPNSFSSSYIAASTLGSGQTVYGRSTYKADLYGSAAELAMLYGQQQARLTQDAQSYGAQAHERFSQINAHQLEVLKLLAKGEAGSQVLRELLTATPAQASFQGSNPVAVPTPDKAYGTPQQNGSMALLLDVIKTDCLACHKQSGVKLDLSRYAEFDVDMKRKVRGRLLSTDPAKRMPRAEDGSAVDYPTEKLQLFFNN